MGNYFISDQSRQTPLRDLYDTFLNRVTFNLVTDIVSGAVLQPLLDILADPDIINLLVELGFSPEPSKTFDKRSGNDVLFLNSFVTSHHTPSQSVSHIGK